MTTYIHKLESAIVAGSKLLYFRYTTLMFEVRLKRFQEDET